MVNSHNTIHFIHVYSESEELQLMLQILKFRGILMNVLIAMIEHAFMRHYCLMQYLENIKS